MRNTRQGTHDRYFTVAFIRIKTIVFQKRIDGIRHEFLKNMIYELKQPKEGDKGEESAVFIGSIAFYYAQNERIAVIGFMFLNVICRNLLVYP